jgi:hypothetical protein
MENEIVLVNGYRSHMSMAARLRGVVCTRYFGEIATRILPCFSAEFQKDWRDPLTFDYLTCQLRDISIEVFSFHLLFEDTSQKCLIATCSANGFLVLSCHLSPQMQLILLIRPNMQIDAPMQCQCKKFHLLKSKDEDEKLILDMPRHSWVC